MTIPIFGARRCASVAPADAGAFVLSSIVADGISVVSCGVGVGSGAAGAAVAGAGAASAAGAVDAGAGVSAAAAGLADAPGWAPSSKLAFAFFDGKHIFRRPDMACVCRGRREISTEKRRSGGGTWGALRG
jgi:hypothetical protein